MYVNMYIFYSMYVCTVYVCMYVCMYVCVRMAVSVTVQPNLNEYVCVLICQHSRAAVYERAAHGQAGEVLG